MYVGYMLILELLAICYIYFRGENVWDSPLVVNVVHVVL